MAELGMGSDTHRVVVEFRKIREDHAGLFTTHYIAKGDIAHTLRGPILSEPTRYSVQVGDGQHADIDGLIEFTNHSCTPSTYLDLSQDGAPRLRATRDIELGGEVTIDYCGSEEDMSCPFTCECGADECYGLVRGYKHLTLAQRAAIGDRASTFLVAKYADERAHRTARTPEIAEPMSIEAV